MPPVPGSGPPRPSRRRRGRRGAAIALVACVLSACGPAAADAPVEPAAAPTAGAPAATPPPAALTGSGAVDVARRATAAGDGMPDVTGTAFDAARAVLRRAGARGHALVFGDGGDVTAQFPAAGQPVPDDASVVVWVGAPAGVTVEVVAPSASRPLAAAAADDPPAPPSDEATSPQPDGLASWYGPGFEGDLTACGERVDPARVTFAGPDLPCGSRVRVTGPDGTTVDAVLTDRGPATWTGRRYNLSRAAFAELADPATGVLPVRVEALD